MPKATFKQWSETVFDHPVREPEWYWDNDFDEYWNDLGMSESLTAEFMTRLFLAPDCLKRYSLEQLAQGIWFLIDAGSPGQSAYSLLASTVPLQQRISCVILSSLCCGSGTGYGG
jgi:hypothetical protein